MEADGVVAEVIFPNTIPPFFPKVSLVHQPPGATDGRPRAQRWAGLQAHNRWMADFCSQAPGRRAGIAQIMLHDVDAVGRRDRVGQAERAHRRRPPARRAARFGRAAALRPRLRTDLGRVRGPRPAGQPPQRQRGARHGRLPGGPDDVPARGHLVGPPHALAPHLLGRDGAPPRPAVRLHRAGHGVDPRGADPPRLLPRAARRAPAARRLAGGEVRRRRGRPAVAVAVGVLGPPVPPRLQLHPPPRGRRCATPSASTASCGAATSPTSRAAGRSRASTCAWRSPACPRTRSG